jgi:hypothetical protein
MSERDIREALKNHPKGCPCKDCLEVYTDPSDFILGRKLKDVGHCPSKKVSA